MNNFSEYLENEDFIDWVFNPDEAKDLFWNNQILNSAEKAKAILQLKEILSFLIPANTPLTFKERSEVLALLLDKIKDYDERQSRRKLYGIISGSAAMIFLLAALGSYYFFTGEKNNYLEHVAGIEQIKAEKTVKLILSDSAQIAIKSDDSVISYNQSGEIIVDKTDTIYSRDNLSNKLIVPYGMRSKIMLSDGTWVYVNSGSQLIYPPVFRGHKREIFLDGEAYFEVAENRNSPFIVRTPRDEYSVHVYGTKFNVSAYSVDDRFEAVLTEGSVTVYHQKGIFARGETRLSPGEMSSWNIVTGQERIVKVIPANYTLWTQGLLLFNDLELNRITKKLERYFDVEIQFADPLKGNILIGGKLDLNNEPEVVLDNLAVTASLKLKKLNKKQFVIE